MKFLRGKTRRQSTQSQSQSQSLSNSHNEPPVCVVKSTNTNNGNQGDSSSSLAKTTLLDHSSPTTTTLANNTPPPPKEENMNTNTNNNMKTPSPVPPPPPPRLQHRRSTMHRTTSSLVASYRATPITKHYALNHQILLAFENHYANQSLEVAYAIGMQFVETALLEIPKHGYFYSSRHATERMTSSLDAIRVSNMLRTILLEAQQQMIKSSHSSSTEKGASVSAFAGMTITDVSEELHRVQKLNHLAVELASEASFDQYETQRAKLEAEINEQKRKEECTTTLFTETCGPFLDSFTEAMCPPGGFAHPMMMMMPFSAKNEELFEQVDDQTTTTKERRYSQQQQQQYEPIMPDDDREHDLVPPPPTNKQQERTVSGMMREIMQKDPPTATSMSSSSRSDPPVVGIPPPPQLTDGWTVLPDQIPERPEFGRQMSGRSYADHVALERALYLSGLEVQPEEPQQEEDYFQSTSQQQQQLHQQPHNQNYYTEYDENWILQHALKESEREMQKLKEEEERQLQEVYQRSKQEEEQKQSSQHQHQQQHSLDFVQPQLQRRMTKSQLETRTLHTLYQEDFVSLWDNGRIRVTHVDTYQGKKVGSVNGCTVIAPLLCIHHFINVSESPGNHVGQGQRQRQNDPGLPDETILTVIDEEVPSILPQVREDLGVLPDAFLIPSDSHDYLIKNQLLSQQQFVTVIGGNILDDRHLQELVKTLQCWTAPAGSNPGDDGASGRGSRDRNEGASNVKIASTLFFHEHVVAILKLQRAEDGKAWYDIIDSLPSKGMLSREIGSAFASNSGDEGSATSSKPIVAGGNPITDPFGFSMMSGMEDTTPTNTARIRCLDEEALTAALRWYACSKFSAENLHYIDNYPWDDKTTDFDPRVFQAFVWSEAS